MTTDASLTAEIARINAKNTQLGIDLTCAKSAIRQVWPYLEEDYNLPNLCTTDGYRDAIERLGRIIGEVVE